MKDLIIETLIIEEDRPAHIARHNITVDEVVEVLAGDYAYIAGREKRWLLIGKTVKKAFLTIVLGERQQENTYGLITAWPARRKERSFYSEYLKQQGGEEHEDKASQKRYHTANEAISDHCRRGRVLGYTLNP